MLVPVKAFTAGKARLAPALDAGQRAAAVTVFERHHPNTPALGGKGRFGARRGRSEDEQRVFGRGTLAGDLNSAECEIVFVEFLGDLVKLHLLTGGERMLAKVGAEEYPALRGREGERIRISWKEEDVQLLDA